MKKSEYHQLMSHLARFDEALAAKEIDFRMEQHARRIEGYLTTLMRRHKKAVSELVAPYTEIRTHRIVVGYIMYL